MEEMMKAGRENGKRNPDHAAMSAEAVASMVMSGGRTGLFSREKDSLLYKLEAEEIDMGFKKLEANA